MLYTQIRYAEEARKLYRLRHLLSRRGRPGIHSQLGFPEYNEQLRRIKNALKQEHVLDRNGRFIENGPNVWLANLALVAKPEETKVLGNRVPYNIFLALAVNPAKPLRGLPRKLKTDPHVTTAATRRMLKAGLIRRAGNAVIPDEHVRDWLLEYIELAKAYAYATGDLFYLFRAVPGYIGGPRAYFDQNYEPGRPIGPTKMSIVTYEPFVGVWKEILRDVRYFKEYPKPITVEPTAAPNGSTWVDSLPYDKRSSFQLRSGR